MASETFPGLTDTSAERQIEPTDATERALDELASNKLVIMHNRSVYAIVGNANSPTLIEDLQRFKADPDRTAVGYTVPFERALPLVDVEMIFDDSLRGLLTDTDELTARIGALSFLCLPGRKEALDDPTVPRGLIHPELHTVMPWSPVGNDFAERLIGLALEQGIEPVMSSANFHDKAEIVHGLEARQFADQGDAAPMVLEADWLPLESARPLGSYPIISVKADHLEITRAGCFSPELLSRCFDGYEVDTAPRGQVASRYPDNIFGMENLPTEYRELAGAELRLGILATLGWQDDAAARLAALQASRA